MTSQPVQTPDLFNATEEDVYGWNQEEQGMALKYCAEFISITVAMSGSDGWSGISGDGWEKIKAGCDHCGFASKQSFVQRKDASKLTDPENFDPLWPDGYQGRSFDYDEEHIKEVSDSCVTMLSLHPIMTTQKMGDADLLREEMDVCAKLQPACMSMPD